VSDKLVVAALSLLPSVLAATELPDPGVLDPEVEPPAAGGDGVGVGYGVGFGAGGGVGVGGGGGGGDGAGFACIVMPALRM